MTLANLQGNLICRGGFRDFRFTIDDNVGSKPALISLISLIFPISPTSLSGQFGLRGDRFS
ncbi:hypothetical protein MC7420_7312 [Coleofasciculus chthonoplastes PCC 7420]|uniref:Uncharacterized protein n=1 Tax=Coleofasciculus chthonoplastes PCC 7420 TaxID=118168 RepID=B4VH59_9CYAN|nr:hypothetical protein MC7420_7312 [Coleofasciculus chthonoplastes PCC 7420]